MIFVTTHSENGKINQVMTLKNTEEADLNGTWIEGHWPASEYYIEGDQAVERPAIGLPETHAVNVNTDWVIPNIPEGTEVFIDEESAGVVDEDDLVLVFGLAATYKVRVEPPFPWKPATCEVTVT